MTQRNMRSKAAFAVAVVGLIGSARAQDVGPVPAANPTGVPGMCSVPGWEYASRWSQPDNGYSSPSEDDCAADCMADPTCDGATWIEFTMAGTKANCWFKEWPGLPGLPCDPPESADKTFNALIKADDCAAIMYSNVDEPGAPFSCPDEPTEQPLAQVGVVADAPTDVAADAPADAAAVVADAPDAMAVDAVPGGPIVEQIPDDAALMALARPFAVAANVEYSPEIAPADGDPVIDLGPGLAATDATDCAMQCTALAGCNLVSWYGADPEWTLSNNCWPKTVATPCVVPNAAFEAPNVFLLIPTMPCEPVAGLPANTNPAIGIVSATAPTAVAAAPAVATTTATAPALAAAAPAGVLEAAPTAALPADTRALAPAGVLAAAPLAATTAAAPLPGGPAAGDFGVAAPAPMGAVAPTGGVVADDGASSTTSNELTTTPGDLTTGDGDGACGLGGAAAVAAAAALAATLLA